MTKPKISGDAFGIAAGVRGAAQIYIKASRRTGRTTGLLNALKDGDRVIFTDAREAARVKKLARDRGVDIATLVLQPHDADLMTHHRPSAGRTIFDHAWVEEFMLLGIEKLANEISFLEREASAPGETCEDTAQKTCELAKWGGL